MTTEMSEFLEGFVPWPDADAVRYRERGYWRGETFVDALERIAEKSPFRVALAGDRERLSYQGLVERSRSLAAGFASSGIGRGDRVLVQLDNRPDFIVVLYALVRLGAIPVVSLAAHRLHEIQRVVALARPRAYVMPQVSDGYDYHALADALSDRFEELSIFVSGDSERYTSLATLDAEGKLMPEVPCAARASDVAMLLMSGGTTGTPKLICRTHDDYLYMVRASAKVAGLGPDSVYVASMPLAHNFTLGSPGAIGALSVGATVAIARSPRADEVLKVIESERGTIASAVPAVAALWVDAAEHGSWDVTSLSVLQIGGAKLSAELHSRLRRVFRCKVQISYGMTEGFLAYTRLDAAEETIRTARVSPLSEADEIRVVDEDGAEVPAGEIGELVVKGPYTPCGYYSNPDQNAGSFTADGMFRTGDLVQRTETGELMVQGRSKDVIKRAGENVIAAELEQLLGAVPHVREVAIIGVEDEFLGEKVCAVIVPNGACPSRLQLVQFLTSEGVAGFKHPDQVVRIDALPRTPMGKIDKKALRGMISNHRA